MTRSPYLRLVTDNFAAEQAFLGRDRTQDLMTLMTLSHQLTGARKAAADILRTAPLKATLTEQRLHAELRITVQLADSLQAALERLISTTGKFIQPVDHTDHM